LAKWTPLETSQFALPLKEGFHGIHLVEFILLRVLPPSCWLGLVYLSSPRSLFCFVLLFLVVVPP
jgi:hypothetical protein